MISACRWIEADLAPGDARASRLHTDELVLRVIESADDPDFRPAYEFLAAKFGRTGALETVPVLAQRFAWLRQPQADGWTLKYQLISIANAAGQIAAVRDHTAAVPPSGQAGELGSVVHLSHALVAETWRRSGLGGWLRALPLQAAREAWRSSGRSADPCEITLVAEMEAAAKTSAERPASLYAYEKAGFRKLDPARVAYHQPDFRTPEEIDHAGGPQPLPFSLVIRRVGRETETEWSGTAARALARAVYRIYRDGCRARDLAPLLAGIETDFPASEERIQLVPPTSA